MQAGCCAAFEEKVQRNKDALLNVFSLDFAPHHQTKYLQSLVF